MTINITDEMIQTARRALKTCSCEACVGRALSYAAPLIEAQVSTKAERGDSEDMRDEIETLRSELAEARTALAKKNEITKAIKEELRQAYAEITSLKHHLVKARSDTKAES